MVTKQYSLSAIPDIQLLKWDIPFAVNYSQYRWQNPSPMLVTSFSEVPCLGKCVACQLAMYCKLVSIEV